ncbi:hypothetical protein DPP32_17745 [Salmonella enterica subsp. enterica serovar Kimberley]|nr:hypothetical protein [Salmonella enterica subsp. enterica serovar Kimberley]
MSRFTTPAILEMLDHYLWRVHEPFEFYLSDDNSDIISVPSGFVTDLASVPKWKRIVMYLAVRWFGRGMYGRIESPSETGLQ